MKEQIGIFYSFLCFYLTDDDSRPIVIIERTRAMIRISGITLRNFKNVKYGTVTMPSFLKKDVTCADILGIYGQNGSGKTAIIDAFEILENIMSGKSLSEKSWNLINVDSPEASIELSFTLGGDDDAPDRFRYTLTFRKEEGRGVIKSELLERRKAKEDESYEREKAVLGYDYDNHEIKPDYIFKKMVRRDKEMELDLLVSSRMAEKNECSFLFSSDGAYEILSSSKDEELSAVIREIRRYAEASLIVFSSRDVGMDSNLMMTLTYRKEEKEGLIKGQIPISLEKPSVISREDRRELEGMVRKMNTVLNAIVPHLTLGVYNAGEELTDEGKKGYLVEIVSLKNGKAIPLRYESEGIIKIISITNVLLCVYNNPSVCLIIDEFDASVFEYLLGEIISIFSKGAKGQMIFTSHNLRILEMIDKDCVVFSTSNPENRYIRLTNIKNTNNLRDVYIRSILLGGTKESIYEETDSQEIGMALRRAWRDAEE